MRSLTFIILSLAGFACDDGGSSAAQLGNDGQTMQRPRDARAFRDQDMPTDATAPNPRDQGIERDGGEQADTSIQFDAMLLDSAQPDFAQPDAGPECPEFDAPLAAWRRPFDTPETTDGRDPHHSGVEPVINAGDDFVLAGKFAYGTFSLDLEREHVVAYVREGDCGVWEEVGREVTDNDGRAEFAVERALPIGRHDFILFVPGDGSRAVGSVWVIEPGTQAVVFDVDGTLTIGDEEIFREVLLGSDPEMYESADAAVQRFGEQGYFVVYVTGRPYFLNPSTRAWLAARDFPRGPIRTTDSVTQSLPTENGVQTFKRTFLEDLQSRPGLEFFAAYGNADTDVCAYAQAGVPPASTWIIGQHGGEACPNFETTNAVLDYPAHLPLLADLPPAR